MTSKKKIQIPLRTPQRPQPVFHPNSVCVDFAFGCRECTHFAWAIHTYIEACGSNTLLGSLVQLYSCTVIMLSSLCTPVEHFVVTSAHTLLGPVCCTTWHYLHTLVVHTLCFDQLYCCTVILYSSLCSLRAFLMYRNLPWLQIRCLGQNIEFLLNVTLCLLYQLI